MDLETDACSLLNGLAFLWKRHTFCMSAFYVLLLIVLQTWGFWLSCKISQVLFWSQQQFKRYRQWFNVAQKTSKYGHLYVYIGKQEQLVHLHLPVDHYSILPLMYDDYKQVSTTELQNSIYLINYNMNLLLNINPRIWQDQDRKDCDTIWKIKTITKNALVVYLVALTGLG